MKITYIEKDVLNQALEAFCDAFKELDKINMAITTASALVSANTEGLTPATFDFSNAKAKFESVNAYTAALLLSNKIHMAVDGKLFRQRMNWLLSNFHFTENWCKSLYDDPDATEDELEQSYQLHDSFCTAVGNLKAVLEKIKSGDIEIDWRNCSSAPVIPDIPTPVTINRKYTPEKSYK